LRRARVNTVDDNGADCVGTGKGREWKQIACPIGAENSSEEETRAAAFAGVAFIPENAHEDRAVLLTLEAESTDVYMAIGGGNNGRYVSYVTFDNDTFHNLITPDASGQKRLLIAGGQEAEYAGFQCVNLETVLRAARTFSQTGELDSALCWDTKPADKAL